MNPFHISNLLSEGHSGECPVLVLGGNVSVRYVDEQKQCKVPPEWAEAGWGYEMGSI
jgi:hypothetical protein